MTIPDGFLTTSMGGFYKFNHFLTGKENYPIIGNADKELKKQIKSAFKKAVGLRKYWSCLEKAVLIQKEIGGNVVLGSHYVYSNDFKSQYGFEFNPDIGEFHAWVVYNETTIDIALPGVIKMGSELKDDVGYYLTGRKPAIFAGNDIPKFLVYEVKELYLG